MLLGADEELADDSLHARDFRGYLFARNGIVAGMYFLYVFGAAVDDLADFRRYTVILFFFFCLLGLGITAKLYRLELFLHIQPVHLLSCHENGFFIVKMSFDKPSELQHLFKVSNDFFL